MQLKKKKNPTVIEMKSTSDHDELILIYLNRKSKKLRIWVQFTGEGHYS